MKGEGNQQDYGMRIYDPRLGRFLSVDPLTNEYPFYSPYQFAGNSPLANIDLDGGEPKPSTIGDVEGRQTSTSEDRTKYVSTGSGYFSYKQKVSKSWFWHSGSVEYGTGPGWYSENDYQGILGKAGFELAGELNMLGRAVSRPHDGAEDRLNKFAMERSDAAPEFNQQLWIAANTQARTRNFAVTGTTYVSDINVDDLLLVGAVVKGAFNAVAKKALAKAAGKMIGSAQTTGTFAHAFTSKVIAWRYALDPRVERVTLDLGYKRIFGTPKAAYKWGPRPDVGVFYKNGNVKAFEIISNTDRVEQLILRNQDFIYRNSLNATVETVKPLFFLPQFK